MRDVVPPGVDVAFLTATLSRRPVKLVRRRDNPPAVSRRRVRLSRRRDNPPPFVATSRQFDATSRQYVQKACAAAYQCVGDAMSMETHGGGAAAADAEDDILGGGVLMDILSEDFCVDIDGATDLPATQQVGTPDPRDFPTRKPTPNELPESSGCESSPAGDSAKKKRTHKALEGDRKETARLNAGIRRVKKAEHLRELTMANTSLEVRANQAEEQLLLAQACEVCRGVATA